MKKHLTLLTLLIAIIVGLALGIDYINTHTGAFHPERIDVLDSQRWNFTLNIINGAEAFSLPGSNETCWLLIHGYTSSPHDFDELATAIHTTFDETVVVPRLPGHGTLPSDLAATSFPVWYAHVEKEYRTLEHSCRRINLIGFSLGGTLSLKLAQNHSIHNLYLISPYLFLRYKWWNIFSKETYITWLANFYGYQIKSDVGQINDPSAAQNHIAYAATSLNPLKKSFPDIVEVRNNLPEVKANALLIQHSYNDDTIDIESSYLIYNTVPIEKKQLITFTKSNHVLLRDYDRQEVINNIRAFEQQTR